MYMPTNLSELCGRAIYVLVSTGVSGFLQGGGQERVKYGCYRRRTTVDINVPVDIFKVENSIIKLPRWSNAHSCPHPYKS